MPGDFLSQRGGGIPARAKRSPQGVVSTRGLTLDQTRGGSTEVADICDGGCAGSDGSDSGGASACLADIGGTY